MNHPLRQAKLLTFGRLFELPTNLMRSR